MFLNALPEKQREYNRKHVETEREMRHEQRPRWRIMLLLYSRFHMRDHRGGRETKATKIGITVMKQNGKEHSDDGVSSLEPVLQWSIQW